MAFKSNWISTCFDKANSNDMTDIDAPRMESHSNEVPHINYARSKEEMMAKDWLKEYAPKTPPDLVLQKPKLDQLNSWLWKVNETVREAPILLIIGPPGAGKSTALKVLAAAQNIQVIEWETPVDIDSSELVGSRNLTQSQANKFEAFLMNSGRYISVLEYGKDMKKLILVKEFPNIFTLHSSLLHDILRRYHAMGRVPIVFSLPEQTQGSRVIFPKQLLEELNVQQISFNKVPNNSVMKALKRICKLNKDHSAPSADVLENIVGNVHGDIRSAILQLNYEFVQAGCGSTEHDLLSAEQLSRKQKSKRTKTSTSVKGSNGKDAFKISKKRHTASKISQGLEACGKDRQLPIFQRVGRLLYPKKTQEDSACLTYDPEEIVDQTLAHPGRLLHMVLENYLKVFRDMNDSCRAIHYASDSDTMMSEFRERELTLPMALSTMARGFMTCKSTVNRKWTPLTNQEYITVRQRTQVMRERIIDIDPKYILVPRDAAMDILPIIHGGFSSKLDSYPCSDELCDTSDDSDESVRPDEGIGKPQQTLHSTIDSPSEIQVLSRKSVTLGKSGALDIKHEHEMAGDTAYEILESESDDENKISEEQADSWIVDNIDFLDNLHNV